MPEAPVWTPLRADTGCAGNREKSLDNSADIDAFLKEVERRAFVMARSMTSDTEDALDIVQDAMFRFVRRYSSRPPQEWRPLFFRIVVNRARDLMRRRSVRNRFMIWRRDERLPDPVEQAPAAGGDAPDRGVMDSEAMEALAASVRELPARQQQAFMLRCLEGLDVKETARAMGCSDGSVKTHYSRALAALRGRLGEHWDG